MWRWGHWGGGGLWGHYGFINIRKFEVAIEMDHPLLSEAKRFLICKFLSDKIAQMCAFTTG